MFVLLTLILYEHTRQLDYVERIRVIDKNLINTK